MALAWLKSGMFGRRQDPDADAQRVLDELASHALTLSHARHISAQKAQDIGLRVRMLERSQELQEAVLTVHHATIQTFSATAATKIVENHLGVAQIQAVQLAGP